MKGNPMQPTDKHALEDLVDKYGLTDVLASLSGICHAKAAHLVKSCQDVELARHWTHASTACSKASTADAVLSIPGK
jgi:hypothetical protein